eukprot:9677219-Alexandrium_andersonii.AAC.1
MKHRDPQQVAVELARCVVEWKRWVEDTTGQLSVPKTVAVASGPGLTKAMSSYLGEVGFR